MLKLNVDGAVFSEAWKAGIGVVLIDDLGNVIMAISKLKNEVDCVDGWGVEFFHFKFVKFV